MTAWPSSRRGNRLVLSAGAARFDEYNTTDDTLSDLVRAGTGRA